MQPLPAPLACGMLGSFAGLLAGGCQCFPVWVGAVSGGGLGCLLCLLQCIIVPIPVAKIVTEPVIVQNIYILEGQPKESPKFIKGITDSHILSA